MPERLTKTLCLGLLLILAIAGGVFAQDVSFSGQVHGGTDLANGSNADNSDVGAGGGGMGRIRLEASAQNDDGTFGGWMRFEAGSWGGTPKAWGLAWWKPIDMLKLQLGTNGGDGEFGADGLAGWSFYDVAQDVKVATEGWGRLLGSFYGGFNDGMVITLTPIEALAINIGIPFSTKSGTGTAEDLYPYTQAQIAYTIDGLGKIAVTYVGGNMKAGGDASKLYGYFNLAMIENLSIELGVGYTFPLDGYNSPVAVGVTAGYGMGAFGIKARVGSSFAGDDKNVKVVADILPSYSFNDLVTVFVAGGMTFTKPDVGDSSIGFHVNPYIRVAPGWQGNASFYAGFDIRSGEPGSGDRVVSWRIPIGLRFGF